MAESIDDIINDIDQRIKDTGYTSIKVTYPKPKKGELTADQKKEIINYYVNKNFKDVTAEGISQAANIPIAKAKNFILNSNRGARTNNIKTLQILTQYLNNLNADLVCNEDN